MRHVTIRTPEDVELFLNSLIDNTSCSYRFMRPLPYEQHYTRCNGDEVEIVTVACFDVELPTETESLADIKQAICVALLL